MDRVHRFEIDLRWTGNRGAGTASYASYGREYEISAPGKDAVIAGSSAPAFRGARTRYNPEELLIAALSSCHMLWFLHGCADAGIVVEQYHDAAGGTIQLDANGDGRFSEVVLHPRILLADERRSGEVPALHERAHERCFIARSVNFPVRCEPASWS
jgi:organic hydroperoxide reductase OsmC/OhrA